MVGNSEGGAESGLASDFSLGGIATLACSLEVSAPKPGNVHRGADFEDVTFNDFIVSAVGLGQVIDQGRGHRLGQTILNAVKQNISLVNSNTNLGMVLLLVPLAKTIEAYPDKTLDSNQVAKRLAQLEPADGNDVFEAIRLASPGGLGESTELDVRKNDQKTIDLIEAMKISADRDAVARQYSNGFADIFEIGIPLLIDGMKRFGNLTQAIVWAHVSWMALEPDSLIARKCGLDTAEHSKFLAGKAVDCLRGDSVSETEFESYWVAVAELDFWLRSDGHRRNPGTTADLIAASLFAAIYNQQILPPFQ